MLFIKFSLIYLSNQDPHLKQYNKRTFLIFNLLSVFWLPFDLQELTLTFITFKGKKKDSHVGREHEDSENHKTVDSSSGKNLNLITQ